MTGIVYGLVDGNTMELHYIGRTILPLHERLRHHLTRSNNPYLIQWLYDADVNVIVLECNPKDLGKAEKLWIESSLKQGAQLLNQQVGGRRGPVSDKTRAKISAALMGKPKSDEHRAKLRGHVRSEETRAKISVAMMGKTPWHKGKSLSDEHKKKIGMNLRGCTLSDEHRAKISKALKGRKNNQCVAVIGL